jgi:hypothetical protein
MSTIILTGDYGYTPYWGIDLEAGTIIDASSASWKLAADSEVPAINLYDSGGGITIHGGEIFGEVSQTAEWQTIYNHFAAGFRVSNSPTTTIQDFRINSAWDAIRFIPHASLNPADGNSSGWLVEDVWISNNRDDAIENDFALTGTVRDSLFDGVFVGIATVNDASFHGVLTVENTLIGMKDYLKDGEIIHGPPFKFNTERPENNPDLRIINSVIAVQDPTHNGMKRTREAWSNLTESSGNYYLNLSDTPFPATYPLPPFGFTILQGQEARDYWEARRAEWLEAHAEPSGPTVTIANAIDDVAPDTGQLFSGAVTNDNSFVLSGLLSTPLVDGQQLVISRADGVDFAPDAVSESGWSLNQAELSDGSYSWTVRILDSEGGVIASSSSYSLVIDTAAPTQQPVIDWAVDNEGPASGQNLTGAQTDDLTPLLQGSLLDSLGQGEQLVVYRDGARVGVATVALDQWSFQEGTLAANSSSFTPYSWQLAVEDAAGNQGPLSDAFQLSIRAVNEIFGTTASDVRSGGDWTDKIWGVPPTGADIGKADIDQMTGNGGADLFVLGAAGRKRFYDDGKATSAGTGDYALIHDFQPGSDKIQLLSGQYITRETTISGVTGTGIYHDSNGDGVWGSRDELIGLVKVVGGGGLSSATDFLFV